MGQEFLDIQHTNPSSLLVRQKNLLLLCKNGLFLNFAKMAYKALPPILLGLRLMFDLYTKLALVIMIFKNTREFFLVADDPSCSCPGCSTRLTSRQGFGPGGSFCQIRVQGSIEPRTKMLLNEYFR